MKHVMIDIETMGTRPYSAIVSIAAVRFDLETGEIGKNIRCAVDMDSCLAAGLGIDAKTLEWWLRQDEHARSALFPASRHTLGTALGVLLEFVEREDFVWANSPRFDLGLLTNACERVRLPVPWSYYNERDVRTLVSFAPEIKENYPRAGTAHDALDDCLYQIGYCCEIWRHINPNSEIHDHSSRF